MKAYKQCLNCLKTWSTFSEFLSDTQVHLSGYQVHATDPGKGLFLFMHASADCQSTLAVKVEDIFLNMQKKREVPKPFRVYGPHCPGLCDEIANFGNCNNSLCKGNTIRKILNEIWEMEYKKGA